MLRLSKASKTFGEVAVLRDVSLDFPPGRITAVLGPNGAGKTTLLNIATGIGSPSSGSVWLNGLNLTSRGPAYHRRAGIVRTFQEPRVFAELSVLENVRFAEPASTLQTLRAAFGVNSRLDGMATPSDRILSLLESFGLRAKLCMNCAQLSYGQRRLVELAMAFASSGMVYLLDEPSAGVALNLRQVVAAQMKEVVSGGASVVVVDHDVEFVRSVADEIVFLHTGQVICRGPTADILNDPHIHWRLWGAWGN